MNPKVFLVITALILITAEILSYINSQLWDVCFNHSPLSEQFNRKKLKNIYFFIEKLKTIFYASFLILLIIASVINIFF